MFPVNLLESLKKVKTYHYPLASASSAAAGWIIGPLQSAPSGSVQHHARWSAMEPSHFPLVYQLQVCHRHHYVHQPFTADIDSAAHQASTHVLDAAAHWPKLLLLVLRDPCFWFVLESFNYELLVFSLWFSKKKFNNLKRKEMKINFELNNRFIH